MFITIEGIDGSGKTAIAKCLHFWLVENGHPSILTREPGATLIGADIRELILRSPLPARAELMLFLADRAIHVETVIRPALEVGKVVVCDRFSDSTMVYQGYGKGLNLGQIAIANDLACDSLIPDLTIWLDVPVAIAKQRVEDRGKLNHLDELGLRSVEAYEAIAKQNPQRVVRVDAEGDLSEVLGRVIEVVRDRVIPPSSRTPAQL